MIRLMQGDCLERMKEIEDGSVDLTVTSPPYDNLRTYNDSLTDWNADKWQAVLRELFRVTNEGGVVVWVVADATIKGSETGTSFRQALYAMDCGFNLHDTMIWEKQTFTDTGSLRVRYAGIFEYMFVFSRGRPLKFNPIKDRIGSLIRKKSGTVRLKDGTMKGISSIGKSYGGPECQRFNLWKVNTETSNNVRSLHPAVFPEALAKDHILSWCNEGDTVLDPFMGSGTTGVACVKTNRKFIGIERDETYFNIAKDRIDSAIEEEKWKLI